MPELKLVLVDDESQKKLDNILLAFHRVEDKITTNFNTLMERITAMAGELEKLQAEVEESRSVTEGAAKLLNELSALIKAAGTDPVKLQELANQLDAQSGALAAAVEANTPAASPPSE